MTPKTIKVTGVDAVITEYASCLFYRDRFEIGPPLLECEGIIQGVSDEDILYISIESGITVGKVAGRELGARPIDLFLMEMPETGGLITFGPRIDEYQI